MHCIAQAFIPTVSITDVPAAVITMVTQLIHRLYWPHRIRHDALEPDAATKSGKGLDLSLFLSGRSQRLIPTAAAASGDSGAPQRHLLVTVFTQQQDTS